MNQHDAGKSLYKPEYEQIKQSTYQAAELACKTNIFLLKQLQYSLDPQNYFWLNPTAYNAAIESRGNSVVAGINNYIQDVMGSTEGFIKINRQHPKYVLGENIANTPGRVIYQTKILELIAYNAPNAEGIPLLVIPSSINKYYIVDIADNKSLIKHLISSKIQPLVISFNNLPKPSFTFAELIQELVQVVQFVTSTLGYSQINVAGYCLGGTLMSILATQLEDKIRSLSFINSGLDYSDLGEFDIFVNQFSMPIVKAMAKNQGLVKGEWLQQMFNLVKSKDVIWKYVQNNYLLGNEPMQSEIMYWNDDAMNQSPEMLFYFIEEMYLGNKLAEGSLVVGGKQIDLSKLSMPKFFLACLQDHIITKKCAYDSYKLLNNGTLCFATGGHINGMITPPSVTKAKHYVLNKDIKVDMTPNNLDANPETWSREIAGSWWNTWVQWLKAQANIQGDSNNKVGKEVEKAIGKFGISAAPGEYAKTRTAPQGRC